MHQEKKPGKIHPLWILTAMMLAGCIFVFHNYIFGNEIMVFGDVGSDTKQQYIMWYNGVANRLRSGTFSLWDFHSGLGVNQIDLNLTGPFTLLIYFLGWMFGPDKIAYFMVWVQILKIFCAGYACWLMLSVTGYDPYAKVIASFLYAFNGYLMVWGQHYMMGSVIVFLPILVWSVEKSFKNRRYLPAVAAASALVILNSYYQGYMCILSVAVYVTIRALLFEPGSFGKRFILFVEEGLAMAFGLVMAAINLIPSLTTLGDTNRLDSSYSLMSRIIANMSLWGKEYYRTLLYRFFGNNLQGAGNEFLGDLNYYEAPSLFFSALLVLLLIQYVFLIHRQKQSVRQKIAQYLGIAAGIFILVIQTGSLVFNGFAYSFSRHTFVLLPYFAMICAWTLTGLIREKQLSIAGLALGLVAVIGVYAKAYHNYMHPTYQTNALILFAGALVMVWALFLLGRKDADRAMLLRMLAGAVFITVVCDSALCYRYRGTVNKTDTGYFEETYHGDTTKALEWVASQDQSFYRLEKDYSNAAYYMESLAQDYRGVSTYNSTQNRYFADFMRILWPQLSPGYDPNHFTFRSGVHEDVMASLSNVKYLLSHDPKPPTDAYELIHQEGEVYVFQNTGTDSVGKFFEASVTTEDFEAARQDVEQWDVLSAVLITEDKTSYDIGAEGLSAYEKTPAKNVLDKKRLDKDHYEETDEGAVIDGTGEVVLPLAARALAGAEHMTAQFDITSETSGAVWIYVNDERGYEHFNVGTESYRINVPADTEQITIRADNSELEMKVSAIRFYKSDADRSFDDGALVDLSFAGNDSHLTGSVDAARDGYVMLAIPMEEGWKVWLDGEETPLTRADYLYMSFPVTAGKHTLEAVYNAPRYKLSAMISLGAFALWLVWTAWTAVQAKKKKKEQQEGA